MPVPPPHTQEVARNLRDVKLKNIVAKHTQHEVICLRATNIQRSFINDQQSELLFFACFHCSVAVAADTFLCPANCRLVIGFLCKMNYNAAPSSDFRNRTLFLFRSNWLNGYPNVRLIYHIIPVEFIIIPSLSRSASGKSVDFGTAFGSIRNNSISMLMYRLH